MNVLEINPSVAGISGDMLIAGLLHLVKHPAEVIDEFSILCGKSFPDIRIAPANMSYQGFEGLKLNITGEDYRLSNEKLQNIMNEFLEELEIVQPYRDFSVKAMQLLMEAEKNVHNTKEAHLHELGTLDTVIDLILPAMILQRLEIKSVNLHPIATGSGAVRTAHGVLPVPAPATDFILSSRELLTITGPQGEATTPTGAALLASLKEVFNPTDAVIWEKSGFGFGTKEFEDRGNFLRTRLGRATNESQQIHILETNIDDISGEFLGHALEKLMEEGALDVNYYPIYMKKNRPGYTLRVLTKSEDSDRIGDKILELTGTLGVRIMTINRHLGNRNLSLKTIFVKEWDEAIEIRIKTGTRQKFEFSDLVKLSERFDTTPLRVREILQKNMED